jgi:hypothetical protein
MVVCESCSFLWRNFSNFRGCALIHFCLVLFTSKFLSCHSRCSPRSILYSIRPLPPRSGLAGTRIHGCPRVIVPSRILCLVRPGSGCAFLPATGSTFPASEIGLWFCFCRSRFSFFLFELRPRHRSGSRSMLRSSTQICRSIFAFVPPGFISTVPLLPLTV